MNGVRTALYTANVDPTYWCYALLGVIDKYNQLHHKTIGKSPYMAFYGTDVPDLEELQIFG